MKSQIDTPDKPLPDDGRVHPSNTSAYIYQDSVASCQECYDAAIADYTKAIELEPTNPTLLVIRGIALIDRSNYAAALQDFDKAIQLDPDDANAYHGAAWIMATSPEAELRNGNKAVTFATKACELSNWKAWHNLGTLAAACAETGDSANAIKWQTQAIEMATKKQDKQAGRDRLELYKSRKPYRNQPASVIENG